MATSTIKNYYQNLTVMSKTISDGSSVAKDAYKSYSKNIEETGYVALGIIGVRKGGAAGGFCAISNYAILNNTTAEVGVLNKGTGTATPSITLDILYMKQ